MSKAPRTYPYDILLCNPVRQSPQYGVLGTALADHTRRIAIDLNTITCACMFGEPGTGKSYAMGSYNEMALTSIPGVNELPVPWATVVFHYSPSPVYKPELAASFMPNNKADQLKRLKDEFGADPTTIPEIVLLAPGGMVEERIEEFDGLKDAPADPQAAFTGIRVERIAFSSKMLTAMQWRILMGAVSEDGDEYVLEMNRILQKLRDNKVAITTDAIEAELKQAEMEPRDLVKAQRRLRIAKQYVNDNAPDITSWLKRGRMVIIDLRDEFIQKREALTLAIVMLQRFSDTTDANGKPIQKQFVLDEAHKYLRDKVLVEFLEEIIREMRHKATSVMIASQDPPSIPDTIIELASLVILLKMSSPQWLNHVKRVKSAFADITDIMMANLKQGEAFIWAKFASDPSYTTKAERISIRPRATRHGGDTKQAITTT